MFNAARVRQSRWRGHWALCTPADRWTKFWQGTSMLESRSSAVSEALSLGVAIALNHPRQHTDSRRGSIMVGAA